ncbi:sulfotransferase family protein [Streptomyces camponoticapitis]|uniref:Sulfotransferase family protein n=1 Tax=Streptomyces camponoticapitis TaxID=1616125 RepID=A0ABQ2E0A9_9ACTN|nr:sulfotransferase [Streptomyces camponoticapitis]GGJ84211.1 sulfotransferase family protein [Streptomyces camponoticapitis]
MTTSGSTTASAQGGTASTGHPEPVFILSPPRSFSTVTLALLAGHPQIFGFPELLVFANERVSDLIGDDGTEAERFPPEYRRTRLSGVYRAIAQVHEGVQTQDALDRARTWLLDRTDRPTTSVLDDLLGHISPLVGVEKSPDTVATDESLARCLTHYPKARYLHLTRHPVTTQRSMQEQNPQYLTNKKVRAVGAATSWYLSHRRIMAGLAELPDDQWMRVRGEDLLREPELWSRRLLDWLGLDSSDDMVDRMLHPESWQFANNGPSGGLYGGDHKFLSNPKLRPVPDPGPVRFDPEWGLLDEMCDRMTGLAHELGY